MSVFSFWLAHKTTKGKKELLLPFFVFRLDLHIKRQKEKRKLAAICFFFRMTSGFARKEMHFDFLVNFGHFGVFHRHKQLFTVQKCENVPKDLLESKTVCWFEVFKEGKQDKVSILLFSVLHLGVVNQKY